MDRVTELTGARLTTSFGRIGGLNRDLPDGLDRAGRSRRLDKIHELLGEVDGAAHRATASSSTACRGTGVITTQDALDFGFTGPCLRANGVNYDVRKAQPYWVYDRIDFDVPVGQNGDNYDRYLMRMEEMKQSSSIIRQALKQMPAGPGHRRRLAHRAAAQGRGLRHHRGRHRPLQAGDGGRARSRPARSTTAPRPPTASSAGTWSATARGRPYKVHVRAPGFAILSGVPRMIEGRMLADLIPTFDTINMIGGEVEQ